MATKKTKLLQSYAAKKRWVKRRAEGVKKFDSKQALLEATNLLKKASCGELWSYEAADWVTKWGKYEPQHV